MIINVVPPPASLDHPQFTEHARHRMRELGVSAEQVRETVRHPQIVIAGGRNHAGGRSEYFGPQIVVVMTPDHFAIITVKLRCEIPYVHGLHRLGNLPVAGTADHKEKVS